MLAPKKAISLFPSVVTPLFWRSLRCGAVCGAACINQQAHYLRALLRVRNYFGRLRVLPKKQMPPAHWRCALLRPLWMKQAERTTG